MSFLLFIRNYRRVPNSMINIEASSLNCSLFLGGPMNSSLLKGGQISSTSMDMVSSAIYSLLKYLIDRLFSMSLLFFFGLLICPLHALEKVERIDIEIKDVLLLEGRLNERVLAQPNATRVVSQAVINYCAGLKFPLSPIGVFLFLGPTGVGKTELSKVLAETLYKTQRYLIRYDMSHFSEPHSVARLIGSPPGYANHDEGGKFTEALKAKPQSVVLLDEIEKAHPSVRKIFLPVFDEGYIKDTKDRKINCRDTIFVMTSNLCSQRIASLFNEGYTDEEILRAIEPELIQTLTPELYNRLQPVIFRPLEKETMSALVDLMLEEAVERIKYVKDIYLTVDKSAKEFLVERGFHPLLGARTLRKLIQDSVIAHLSYAIVRGDISQGSRVKILYENEEWLLFVDD